MKKILIVLFIMLLCGPVFAKPKLGTKLPLAGKSLANVKLQADTLLAAYTVAGSKNKGCEDMNIVNTQVLIPPKDLKIENGKYVSGYWVEGWDINCCGHMTYVPIQFFLDKTGTSYSIKSNLVKVDK